MTAPAGPAVVRRRRAPLMALALVALFAGLWGGLVRLGLFAHTALTVAAAQHGPLMALGFLGTLISLERAVALDRPWAYAAPLAAGTGALLSLTGAPAALGPALVSFGGIVLLGAHGALQQRQPSAHNAVMGLGAIAWCAAGVDWLSGADPSAFAPLLAGFLVLTIVGERLELTRAAHRSRGVRSLLLAAVAVFCAGLAVSLAREALGTRIAGAGLVGQALWLARYDIARRTARIGGVTRYMASALLVGYAWLICAGVLWLADPSFNDGPAYDAELHAVFLGFVMSMVFAHAPVIVPAVLRVQLPYNRAFYGHLALLHVALATRLIGGDLLGSRRAWQWGAVGNGTAILIFLAATAIAVSGARRSRRRAAIQLPAALLKRPREPAGS